MSKVHWRQLAACSDTDEAIWFAPEGMSGPDTVGYYERAKAICETCPVRHECLADALATESQRYRYGFRGGVAPSGRDGLRLPPGARRDANRSRNASPVLSGEVWRTSKAPLRIEHGTRTAYVYGCRCDPCRDAEAVYSVERKRLARAAGERETGVGA